MTDVAGGSTSAAPGLGRAPDGWPEWGTHADSLRAEAQLPASEIGRPLERFLGRYSTDRALVRRISRAVRESRRQRVPPSLIAAVLVTENTTLRPEATSSVGALGLMQVMPMHAGAELCRSSDLVDVDSNICHGTLILARELSGSRTVFSLTSIGSPVGYIEPMRGKKAPAPPRPTHIERYAKTIRDIDKRCAGLQERMEYTSDPEQQAYIEQQLRTLEEGRSAPIEALAEWYRGLSGDARREHEDFVRRCTTGGAEALLAARPGGV